MYENEIGKGIELLRHQISENLLPLDSNVGKKLHEIEFALEYAEKGLIYGIVIALVLLLIGIFAGGWRGIYYTTFQRPVTPSHFEQSTWQKGYYQIEGLAEWSNSVMRSSYDLILGSSLESHYVALYSRGQRSSEIVTVVACFPPGVWEKSKIERTKVKSGFSRVNLKGLTTSQVPIDIVQEFKRMGITIKPDAALLHINKTRRGDLIFLLGMGGIGLAAIIALLGIRWGAKWAAVRAIRRFIAKYAHKQLSK